MLRITTGQWAAKGSHLAYHISALVRTTEGEVVKTEEWKVVADVRGDTPEECEANARLIAAAPDLLDALKSALCSLTGDAADLCRYQRCHGDNAAVAAWCRELIDAQEFPK